MGESWGVAWLLWILVLGARGFALGSIVVFTASAPMSMRVVAAASMVAAFFIAVGLILIEFLIRMRERSRFSPDKTTHD